MSFERVMVVGTSCAGKTTVARRMAKKLGVCHVELDALHWGPNWTERPADAFRREVSAIAAKDRWVIDGNYAAVRDIVMARATDAVWLNYSFGIVFGRAIRRTARRVATREEIWNGNRETFTLAFLRPDSIPWWVVRTHRRRRRAYGALFAENPSVTLSELRTQRETDAFLSELEATPRTGAPSGGAARTSARRRGAATRREARP